MEKLYCVENGRTAIEPVVMLGVSILQDLDGVPDRQAVELLRYHAGWNFALNRQLGDAVFHPSSLVHFRHRLEEKQQSALGFKTILDALVEAGLVSRQSRQRLDSTQMFGRVAKMSRLDCVRESVRLALRELEPALAAEARPVFWLGLWERYVESQVDYRAGAETLSRKLVEAGTDAWQLLEWLRQAEPAEWAKGEKVQLLRRVFGEQFAVVAGQAAPLDKEKTTMMAEDAPKAAPQEAGAVMAVATPSAALGSLPLQGSASAQEVNRGQLQLGAPVAPQIEPKGKGQLSSDRVQNPHESDATYGAKGEGERKKEHVGYKIQVAETVSEAVLAPGEPTCNFLTGIVTHAAYQSDEAGSKLMDQEQAQMGMAKPPVQYVDGAYVSAEELVRAQAEGRELDWAGSVRAAQEWEIQRGGFSSVGGGAPGGLSGGKREHAVQSFGGGAHGQSEFSVGVEHALSRLSVAEPVSWGRAASSHLRGWSASQRAASAAAGAEDLVVPGADEASQRH